MDTNPLPASPLDALLKPEKAPKWIPARPAPDAPPDVPAEDRPLEAGPLAVLDDLLRAPDRLTRRLAEPALRLDAVRVLLVAMVAGAAVFGAAIGMHRSPLQSLFAATKLPIITFLLAATTLPALVAFRRAARAAGRPITDAGHVLSVFSLGSLVLTATAPIPVLAVLMGAGYHRMVLVATACVALAGLVALQRLGTLLEVHGGNLATIAGACVVMALVGSQLTWSLRPFIARPTVDVTFVRPDRMDLFESLGRTLDSARGIYRELETASSAGPAAVRAVVRQHAPQVPQEVFDATERLDRAFVPPLYDNSRDTTPPPAQE